MEINITTPALIFPAISLLLLAYSNRFNALAAVIRALSAKLNEYESIGIVRQIETLQTRIKLIRTMQGFSVLSLLGCVIAMMFLFLDMEVPGRIVFALSLVLMALSLLMSLWEIFLSGNALKIELEDDMAKVKQQLEKKH